MHRLQEGAAVTSLSFANLKVAGLSSPIVLKLPFPSSAATTPAPEETFYLNCSENVSVSFPAVSSQDVDRASYCGYELFDDDRYLLDDNEPPPNRTVHCAATNESFTLSCVNKSGTITFSCPKKEYTGSCEYWDAEAGNWTDENCTLWYVDVQGGFSVCNCTHLTDFVSEQGSVIAGQAETFTSTVATADDLSVSDLQKNLGIIIVLACVWIFCLFFLLRDKWQRKVDTTVFLFEILFNPQLEAKFRYAKANRQRLREGDYGDLSPRNTRRGGAQRSASFDSDDSSDSRGYVLDGSNGSEEGKVASAQHSGREHPLQRGRLQNKSAVRLCGRRLWLREGPCAARRGGGGLVESVV